MVTWFVTKQVCWRHLYCKELLNECVRGKDYGVYNNTRGVLQVPQTRYACIYKISKQWTSWLNWWLIFCSFVILLLMSNKGLVSSPAADQTLGEYKDLIVSLKCLASPWIRDSYFLLTSSSHDCNSCSDFLEPIYTQIKECAQCTEPAPHHTSLAMQSCSVIVTETSLMHGHCAGLICFKRGSHFPSDWPTCYHSMFLLFLLCSVCWTDWGQIFSRMLVSHGGLDVFYPVSSTIWNQCSWRRIAAAE